MQIGEGTRLQCRISSIWLHPFVEPSEPFWNYVATARSFLVMMHLGIKEQLPYGIQFKHTASYSDAQHAKFCTQAFDSSDEGYDGLLVGVVAVSGTGGAFAARKAGIDC